MISVDTHVEFLPTFSHFFVLPTNAPEQIQSYNKNGSLSSGGNRKIKKDNTCKRDIDPFLVVTP